MSDQPAPVKRGRGRPKGSGKKKQPVADGADISEPLADIPVEPTLDPSPEPDPNSQPEVE